MTLVPVGELLRAEGALHTEDVLRFLPLACDALGRLAAGGVMSGIDLNSLHVSKEDGAVHLVPVPITGGAQAQVRAVAALAYELLKGVPAPAEAGPEAWLGVRPELVRVLAPALLSSGAGDLLTLALQLRRLGKGGTAHYVHAAAPGPAPVPDDTVPRVGGGAALTAGVREGELLGAYELIGRLGEGGMGEVYLARHVRLGRQVAIKLLKRELAGLPDVVRRFFQEARLVNEIDHPHIVQILDFVEEPGRAYCVMELLEGHTLAELDAREGPLRLARVCRVMAQVCDALDAAHRRGVVHRDVKPENIFVTRGADGADFAKVLDFGIARDGAEASRTQHGLVLGTPRYMAPEQAAGRAVDARADLYAVGLMLFETLSHQSTAAVAPTPVTRTAAGEPVPAALGELVTSCLALDPTARPASAAEVARVLRADGDPESLPRHALRRAPLRLALAGLAAAAIAALTLFLPERSPTPAPPASEAPASLADPENLARSEPPAAAKSEGRPAVAQPPDPQPIQKPKREGTRAASRRVESPRLAAVKERYEALRRRHGLEQLTTLERAAVQQALATPGAVALDDAERALDDAEARLGR
jgi:serine/threonine-protein kinase